MSKTLLLFFFFVLAFFTAMIADPENQMECKSEPNPELKIIDLFQKMISGQKKNTMKN